MLAVKPWTKFWPPTGPISPMAKKPATGIGPRISWIRLDVVVGLVEQAGAAAVASEEQGTAAGRAGWAGLSRACEQALAEVLVGGLGVADVELDGLADAGPGR